MNPTPSDSNTDIENTDIDADSHIESTGGQVAMLAVIPVREGVTPLGADEVVAEAGGSVLLIGSGCRDAAEQLGGAHMIRMVDGGDFAAGRWTAMLAAALPELGPEAAGHLLLPASPDGRDLGPRLAATLNRAFVASAIRVGPTRAEITRFGGRVSDTLSLSGPVVATLQSGVRGTETTDSEGGGPVPRLEEVAATSTEQAAGQRVDRAADPRLVEMLPADPSTMDLAEASRIVGGGAGLGSPEAFERLRELADRLGASTGGTRVVTDWGWLPVERQIGTTGVTVDPSLYLAFGISGAVQHTAGLGSPEHIISVNLDPHCPMMGLADLAIVCDGPAVVHELLQRL